jgi:hypothetical protein
VSYLTATNDRDTNYIEQEAEHAKREAVLESRERHYGGYRRTPELDGIREQLAEIRRRESVNAEIKYRTYKLLAMAREGDSPEFVLLLDQAFALLVTRGKEIEVEHSRLLEELNKELAE